MADEGLTPRINYGYERSRNVGLKLLLPNLGSLTEVSTNGAPGTPVSNAYIPNSTEGSRLRIEPETLSSAAERATNQNTAVTRDQCQREQWLA